MGIFQSKEVLDVSGVVDRFGAISPNTHVLTYGLTLEGKADLFVLQGYGRNIAFHMGLTRQGDKVSFRVKDGSRTCLPESFVNHSLAQTKEDA